MIRRLADQRQPKPLAEAVYNRYIGHMQQSVLSCGTAQAVTLRSGEHERAVTYQSDLAVELLQRLIERGELKPGSMVSERALMDVTGFGRTPIREAVQRLALTRMLRIHPSRGVEISSISVEDQLCALEVRRVSEVLTVSLACERATIVERDDMRKLALELGGDFMLPDYAETVRRTHTLVMRAAHNPYLDALMIPLQASSRRFWFMHVRDDSREIGSGKKLHQRILTAVVAGDVDAATRASIDLNDYLTAFALGVVSGRMPPREIGGARSSGQLAS